MSGRSETGKNPEPDHHDPQNREVYEITSASASLTEDQSARIRAYVIQMTIRMVCFGLAIFTEGWIRWVFFVAAMILPYFAVVFANNTRVVTGESLDKIETTPTELTAVKTDENMVPGEVIDPHEINEPDGDPEKGTKP